MGHKPFDDGLIDLAVNYQAIDDEVAIFAEALRNVVLNLDRIHYVAFVLDEIQQRRKRFILNDRKIAGARSLQTAAPGVKVSAWRSNS